jgi:hypothetical protein
MNAGTLLEVRIRRQVTGNARPPTFDVSLSGSRYIPRNSMCPFRTSENDATYVETKLNVSEQ